MLYFAQASRPQAVFNRRHLNLPPVSLHEAHRSMKPIKHVAVLIETSRAYGRGLLSVTSSHTAWRIRCHLGFPRGVAMEFWPALLAKKRSKH